MIYFSAANQAFYHPDVHQDIPGDAVAITDEEHLPLVDKLNQGCYLLVADGQVITTPPRPTADHSWDGQAWVISPERAAALKAARQAEMWEHIKIKRHDNLRGGVYIRSIGKWMHTNDESRTQYLALGLLPTLPENLRWKTMENDFVPMSKALLQEIYLTMLADEQADFANAERHKAAMEAADNPLEYDYSDGWTQTYQPPASSAPAVTETAQEPPVDEPDGDTQADAAAGPVADLTPPQADAERETEA